MELFFGSGDDYLSELTDKEQVEYFEEQYNIKSQEQINDYEKRSKSNDKGGKEQADSVQERDGNQEENPNRGNKGEPNRNQEGEKNGGGIDNDSQLNTKNILVSLFDNICNVDYGKLGQLTKEIISRKKRLRSIFTEDRTRTTESQRRTIEAILILEGARAKSGSDMGFSRKTQSQQEDLLRDYAKQEGILLDEKQVRKGIQLPIARICNPCPQTKLKQI